MQHDMELNADTFRQFVMFKQFMQGNFAQDVAAPRASPSMPLDLASTAGVTTLREVLKHGTHELPALFIKPLSSTPPSELEGHAIVPPTGGDDLLANGGSSAPSVRINGAGAVVNIVNS
jgi:hypothetical protein